MNEDVRSVQWRVLRGAAIVVIACALYAAGTMLVPELVLRIVFLPKPRDWVTKDCEGTHRTTWDRGTIFWDLDSHRPTSMFAGGSCIGPT